MRPVLSDLDRGKLVSYPGNYDLYLTAKEENLRVEALQMNYLINV